MVALVDQSLYQWFKTNLPIFETIPVTSTGTSSSLTPLGRINSITAYGIDDQGKNATVYMIQSWPDAMSLDEAYNFLIKNVDPR